MVAVLGLRCAGSIPSITLSSQAGEVTLILAGRWQTHLIDVRGKQARETLHRSPAGDGGQAKLLSTAAGLASLAGREQNSKALPGNTSFINPSAEQGGRNCHNNSSNRLI